MTSTLIADEGTVPVKVNVLPATVEALYPLPHVKLAEVASV
jgi:hypothetical protein